MRQASLLAVIGFALAFPSVGSAHKPSDSYLTLTVDDGRPTGRWDVALRDLEHALGLDADLDGAITWGELRSRHEAIAEYALARLEVSRGSEACSLRPVEQLVDHHTDGAYSVLRFDVDCPAGGAVRVDYRLFFDLDPTHRGLLQIGSSSDTTSISTSPELPICNRPRWVGTRSKNRRYS